MNIKRSLTYITLTLAWLANSLAGTAQTPVTLPTPYSSNAKINYVRTWDAKAPEQNPATLITRPLKDVQQTTAYLDGLGRPLQTVVKQGSLTTGSSPADLVSPVVYDEFGREKLKYLPFGANNAGSNTSINDGLIKLNPFQQQVQFYNTQLSGQPGETNVGTNSLNWAYGQTTFEASPLNRVQESFAPGSSWVGSASQTTEANRRSVKTKYFFNTVTDSVRILTVTDPSGGPGTGWGTYAVTGVYAAGELYKNVTVDEHGKQVIEFKDKEGQVLLKKVQFSAAPDNGVGSGYTGWLCTYYVYDNLNNLRLVIQPKGVELLAANSWNITWNSSVILNEQCFRYEYDHRRRMIMKKVPATAEVYMVYDRWDRLVLTQDANLRLNHNWLYTKYDNLNRPIITGSHHDPYTLTLAGMINNVKENESWQIRYETRDNSTIGYTLTQSYPYQGWQSVYTVTFYDDYDWTTVVGAPNSTRTTTFDSYLLPASASWPYAQPITQTTVVRGLATGGMTRILGTESFLTNVNIYDDKQRIIQVKQRNYTQGTDITTTQYSFSGQPLVVITYQDKQGANPQTHTTVTKLEYDDLGRLLTTKKMVSSTISGQTVSKPEQVLARNEYDALGQLKKEILSPPSGGVGGGLETLTYDYNIRGWLLGANRKYLLDQGTSGYTDNYFGFELAYDKTGTMPGTTSFTLAQYNGNIAGTLWKSKGDAVRRKYDFDYDAVNRFGKATFTQNTATSGGAWNTTEANFSVHGFDSDNNFMMKYDANGNILSMVQHGIQPGSTDITIDALRYKYKQTGNSNQLEQVWDDQNVASTKLGDFHYTGTKLSTAVDYVYDSTGNLISDNNKSISGITYNHLNLPTVIPVTGKGSITYTYDATGNKLKKTVLETGKPAKTTLYLGGCVYENDTLQFIGHEEGRLRYVKRKFTNGDSAYQLQYDYFLKDHLGNVRMVLTEQTDTTQYLASMETAYRTKEEQLFYNIPQTAIAKTSIAGYPTDPNPVTVPNDLVAKVNGSGNKVGPAIVLKVMSGDKVDIAVKSFYKSGGTAGSNSDPITDILTSLAAGIVGAAGESKGTLATLNNSGSSPLLGALNSFRSTNNPNQASKPKAYLNWILLDEQLKYVAAGSGAQPVQSADAIYALAPGTVNIPKNGFLYIYVSNETQNWDVFFDNLSIQHTTGPITEETHYYPFGLTMAGISSKALKPGYAENKKRYNGIEQNTDFDLNMYDAFYRNLDPQIGRFWQVDPKPADHESPYASMANNPISKTDPLGDTTILGQLFAGFKFGGKTTVEGGAGQFASITRKLFSGNPHLAILPDGKDLVEMFQGAKATGEYLGDKVKSEKNGWAYAVGFLGEKVAEGLILKKITGGGGSKSVPTEEGVSIFRGLNESHPGYGDALNGVAKPRGGTATAVEHNAGNTSSPFTSWTTNREVAVNYALRPNGTGVVLEVNVPKNSMINSPSLKNVNLKQSPGIVVNESEVLLKGAIFGAKVTKP